MNTNNYLPSEFANVSQPLWDGLSQQRVFFGHQSVGQNIIEGLQEIVAQHPAIRINIRNTVVAGDLSAPVFAHSLIGRNMDPLSKISHFRRILDNGLGQVLDVAMFKFCYVDVTQNTDIADLLVHYDEAMISLKKSFPHLKIITFTTPLTSLPNGIKPMIKSMLGRYDDLRKDNMSRHLLNERLRAKYSESVFDLADIEATKPNGAKAGFKKGGKFVPLLEPSNTGDGGHLNRAGRLSVAAKLLLFLLKQTKS